MHACLQAAGLHTCMKRSISKSKLPSGLVPNKFVLSRSACMCPWSFIWINYQGSCLPSVAHVQWTNVHSEPGKMHPTHMARLSSDVLAHKWSTRCKDNSYSAQCACASTW